MKETASSYSDPLAFDRLLLLIATLVHYPGVGCPDPEADRPSQDDRGHHNALEDVRTKLHEIAKVQRIALPEGYPSLPTLRKDLQLLRKYGILDQRMYRWGYYLGTGAMTQDELRVALDAIASQAKRQGDPLVRQIHKNLCQRLRGMDLDLKGKLFYPVRQSLDRAINYTDPDEMITLGKHRDTLFHKLEMVEQAISRGQSIEISRHTDPYKEKRIGPSQVYPLQLVYHNVAWYLIQEDCQTGHLFLGRINRFKDHCIILDPVGRGIDLQQKSLHKAHKLLSNGWGLNLGNPEEQQAELQGWQKLIQIKVRFFPPVVDFILEGELRHHHQKIRQGPQDQAGNYTYVDYSLKLPPRSLKEFTHWVNKYLDCAQILEPMDLAEVHQRAAERLVARYRNSER